MSICIQCFNLKCILSDFGNNAWCDADSPVFDGMLPMDHPFLTSERNCGSYEGEEGEDESKTI